MSLGSLIYKALKNTQDNPIDEVFSMEITNAIESFLEQATGVTIDAGTTLEGVYAGEGTLNLVHGDIITCNTTILECCNLLQATMPPNGNKVLADSMALAIYLLGFNGSFVYNSVGVATQGIVTTPMSGVCKGNLTINQTLLSLSLESLFSSFNALPDESIGAYNSRLGIGTIYTDNNESFAHKFADILQPILASGQILTKGELNLEGVIGQGTLIFVG